MNIIKWGHATLLVLLSCSVARGQNLNGAVQGMEESQKPNSSKGSTSGSMVNVDPYTGVGSVTIPMHAYSLDGLDFGVSVNYNAKGVRVDEMASSIGLGWSLNAGGSITRTVYGLEDEVTLPTWYIPGSGSNPSWPYRDSVEGRWAAVTSNFSAKSWSGATGPVTNNHHVDDIEYDVFHFNACGRSFNFIIKDNTTWLTYPNSEVKIEFITKDGDAWDPLTQKWLSYKNIRSGVGAKNGIDTHEDILTFIVTDEKGNKFYFERGDYEVKTYELDSNLYSPHKGLYYPIQKWNLARVRTYAGNEVSFEYERTYFEFVDNVTETLFPRKDRYDAIAFDSMVYDPLVIKENKWKGNKTHISKIFYPNNSQIVFDIANQTHQRCDCQGDFRLRNILFTARIGDQSNTIKYVFNQAYFSTPILGNSYHEKAWVTHCNFITAGLTIPTHLDEDSIKDAYLSRGLRLKLKGIDKVAFDNTSVEPLFSFEYKDIPLPLRFSSKKDYYGYYNGAPPCPYIRQHFSGHKDTFLLSIPYHEDENYYERYDVLTPWWGQNRNPNFDSMQACALVKIGNGIGGEYEIQYTNYVLSNPDSAYGYVNRGNMGSTIGYSIDPLLEGRTANDGLCVGKIYTRNKYSTDHTQVTEYTYSAGERFHQGGYTWYPDIEMNNHNKVLNNFFVGPHDYVNGSNHGFGKVTIISKGWGGERLSKEVTTFSNLMYTDENGNRRSSLLKPTGLYWHTMPAEFKKYRMGIPLKTERYDALDFLISVDTTVYEKMARADSNNFNSRYFGPAWWEERVLDYEWLRLVSTSTHRYTRDLVNSTYRKLSTSYEYEFDNYDNIKVVKWSDSRGVNFKKFRYYNYDYYPQYSWVEALSAMHLRKMQHELSTETWMMKGDDSLLLGMGISTPILSSASDTSILTNKAAFAVTIGEPMLSVVAKSTATNPAIVKLGALDYGFSFSGSSLKKISEITKRDTRLNVLELKVNDREIYTSTIWDVETGQKLAHVKNAKYADIAYSSFESKYNSASVPDIDYSKGNLNFDPELVAVTPIALTGKKVIVLGNGNDKITTQILRTKKYVISYWTHTLTGPQLEINYQGTPIGTITPDLYNSLPNNWHLWSAEVEIDSGQSISLKGGGSSANVILDEIRLHPIDAEMVSWTYKPLCGISSATNPHNIIQYTEYDIWGRLHVLRDMRMNIISQFEKKYNAFDGNYTDNGNGQGPHSDD